MKRKVSFVSLVLTVRIIPRFSIGGVRPYNQGTAAIAVKFTTRGSVDVRVRLRDGPALRIEVEDDGAGTPEPQPLTETEEHGRGLYLVGALSASWGMEAGTSGGKRVWADLAIPVAAAE